MGCSGGGDGGKWRSSRCLIALEMEDAVLCCARSTAAAERSGLAPGGSHVRHSARASKRGFDDLVRVCGGVC